MYQLEKLRCHLCGKVFTAEAPEGVGEKKYDETAASMIALLRYGSGFPWNRLEGLEEGLGIPLPSATQCEIVAETAVTFQPALKELRAGVTKAEIARRLNIGRTSVRRILTIQLNLRTFATAKTLQERPAGASAQAETLVPQGRS